MISRNHYRNGVWVDLEQPTAEEVHELSKELGISEHIERELLSPSPIPLVTGSDSSALLVLHFPIQSANDGDTKTQEIDFVVGEKFILTVRYEIVAPLHHLKKLLEAQALSEKKSSVTTDILLEILFAHLYTSLRDHMNHVASNLTRVEKEMFGGHERSTVRSISNISREFLHMEGVLANQEEVLRRFLDTLSSHGYFGHSFAERSLRILSERAHVARTVKTHRAIATEMRETNTALLGARQSEIMKTLTLITVILFPLEFIAVTFGMHAPGTPLEQNPNGFWIILGIMGTITVLMLAVFARKRWIF
ncbi:MAG: Magnesium and cobalt transport protein CorA [Parcubacteria group bacterium]|nr:Magnesium and cobalt transport protein CorA [Parcubacteria group bacterium]